MSQKTPLKIKRTFDIGLVAIVSMTVCLIMALALLLVEESVDRILFEKAQIRVSAMAREAGSILEHGGTEEDLQEFVLRENNRDGVIYAIVINKEVTAVAHSEEAIRYRVYQDEYTVEGVQYGRVQNEMWYSESLGLWGRDIMAPIYVHSEYYGIMDVGMVPDMGTSSVVAELLKRYILIALLGVVLVAVAVSILTRLYLLPVLNSTEKIEQMRQERDVAGQKLDAIEGIVTDVGKIVSMIHKNMGATGSGEEPAAANGEETDGQ